MAKQEVTAVFDIGKTNKKFFLFDQDYNEVYSEYSNFDEIEDEDGFPTEDLNAIKKWLKKRFDRILKTNKYKVKSINFSTYGASLVHLDKNGKVLTPLYNYIKPVPEDVLQSFFAKHGDSMKISSQTASPIVGNMLNSGLQLYWLKQTQPNLFSKIKYSLHFPQYLSFLFTGIPLTEYTSIGCHTGLWDYKKNDYHKWVRKEKLDVLFPSIVSPQTSINMSYGGKKIQIGVGIHDSSSALLPYVLSEDKPFLLLSTGTWSIALNPFNTQALTIDDIKNNCLNYMRINGSRVMASRFFLGNEYKHQVKKLSEHFGKEYGYHRSVKFRKSIYTKLISSSAINFKFDGISLERKELLKTDLKPFLTFEEAYHKLMIELVDLQVYTLRKAIGETPIKKIFIDGGFTNNDMFLKLVTFHFKDYKVSTTKSPLGSALGAAMVISDKKLTTKFLKENYKLKKLTPISLVKS